MKIHYLTGLEFTIVKNVRKPMVIYLGSLLLGVLSTACELRPLNSAGGVFKQVGEVTNIVWTLASCEQGGQSIDLSPYEPFHLIIGSNRFFGDDGCNLYAASYTASNDSIFPGLFAMTERACSVQTFSTDHLATAYSLRVEEDRLEIRSGNATYTYESDFTEEVDGSPLVGKVWELTDSNDPTFDEVKAMPALIPTLTFDETRQYQVQWYCVSENGFGCNELTGVYGISPDDRILFYQQGGQTTNHGLNLVENILRASKFTVENDSMTLSIVGSSTFFEFSRRSGLSARYSPN